MSLPPSAPPTLLNLTIESAVARINRITNLNCLPDHIVLDLFRKTLQAGKLTERILMVFMATGNEQVKAFVKEKNIRTVLRPILPTRCSEKF